LEISVARGPSVSHDVAVLALLLAEWGSAAQRRWRGYKVVVPTGCSKPTVVAPEAACQNVARYRCLSTSCQVRQAAERARRTAERARRQAKQPWAAPNVTVGHTLVQLGCVAHVLVGRRPGFGPVAFLLFFQFPIKFKAAADF
jgi:hypothetical protein